MTVGYSAREIPFYGLPASKIVREAPTVEDAIRMAELDWTVSLEPVMQRKRDGSYVEVSNKFLTVREDTEQVLGTVGKNYRTFQNAEAFDFADALLGYGVEFDAAGHYSDSRKIFLTAKLPTGITVPGTDDSLDLYLLFRTSHDGTSAIESLITPVRLACTNMNRLATRQAISKWTARHTSSAKEKVDEAARTLNLVDSYREEYEKISAQLLETEVNLAGFEKLVEDVTSSERLRTGMVNTWTNSPSVDRRTGWGALNSITEFMQWERGGRGNPETRFHSMVDGQSQRVTERATRLLLTR